MKSLAETANPFGDSLLPIGASTDYPLSAYGLRCIQERASMVGRKVLVLWINPLFHETVRLLLQKADVEVVGALRHRAPWREQVQRHQPDTVIIESEPDETSENGETLSILRSGPTVIRLSLSDNDISLYKRQQKNITDADELIELILSEKERAREEGGSNDEGNH
jgi:chemotaxis response regulator CheB